MAGASVQDIRLRAEVTVCGTVFAPPAAAPALDCYKTADVRQVPDEAFAALLGRPIPQSRPAIDRNLTLGELNHTRAPLGWLISAVLRRRLNASVENGRPDLNVMFQYNMPLRALAKITNGMVSMGMVDGLVMELKGFWLIGLARVLYEFVKNQLRNAALEKRLKRGA